MGNISVNGGTFSVESDSTLGRSVNTLTIASGATVQFWSGAQGALYSIYFDGINGIVPDNSANGCQNSRVLAPLLPDNQVVDVNVTFHLSGGFNGDLYAHLVHDRQVSVLLNRVGRTALNSVGYPDAGFGPLGPDAAGRFRFDDQATGDIHLYRAGSFTLNGNNQLTGAWQPDGRDIDSASAGVAFDAATRSRLLDVFNGRDPNGGWTLFFADLSAGDQSTLVGWGLAITAVPEPTHLALAVFGGVLGVGALIRHLARRPGMASSA